MTVTKTVTVEQPAPSPESVTLAATIKTQDCSFADLGGPFTLRKPGNGFTKGDVLAVASSVTDTEDGCGVNVLFDLTPDMAIFVVEDERSLRHWGPLSYNQVKDNPFLNLTLP